MANIAPLKGVLYNTEKINDVSKVVAPPYDVISPAEQEGLYNSDPHNIIRILLGKDMDGDNDKENKYARAAKDIKKWQEEEVLKRDAESCIYPYMQEFEVDGKKKRRMGFLALLKLEDFGSQDSSVYPHEDTLDGPKKDRTSLISSIEANLGPVFALFADEKKEIDDLLFKHAGNKPLIDIMDSKGIINKLWRISDKDSIEKIVSMMRSRKIFIADGHHRYEVALAFSKTKSDPKYGYILTYFTDIYGEGVVVLPTYRVLKGIDEKLYSRLMDRVGNDFSVKEFSSAEEMKAFMSSASDKEKRFALHFRGRFTGLAVNGKEGLNVTVLHDMIIRPLQAEAGDKISIDFIKDLEYAINMADSDDTAMAVILNATKVTEIRDTAFSGKRMPQKTTYFYPKVTTGLVINIF